MVRIAGSHPAGPGSIPGVGTLLLHRITSFVMKSFTTNVSKKVNVLVWHFQIIDLFYDGY